MTKKIITSKTHKYLTLSLLLKHTYLHKLYIYIICCYCDENTLSLELKQKEKIEVV